jgi:hypothetical protein
MTSKLTLKFLKCKMLDKITQELKELKIKTIHPPLNVVLTKINKSNRQKHQQKTKNKKIHTNTCYCVFLRHYYFMH